LEPFKENQVQILSPVAVHVQPGTYNFKMNAQSLVFFGGHWGWILKFLFPQSPV